MRLRLSIVALLLLGFWLARDPAQAWFPHGSPNNGWTTWALMPGTTGTCGSTTPLVTPTWNGGCAYYIDHTAGGNCVGQTVLTNTPLAANTCPSFNVAFARVQAHNNAGAVARADQILFKGGETFTDPVPGVSLNRTPGISCQWPMVINAYNISAGRPVWKMVAGEGPGWSNPTPVNGTFGGWVVANLEVYYNTRDPYSTDFDPTTIYADSNSSQAFSNVAMDAFDCLTFEGLLIKAGAQVNLSYAHTTWKGNFVFNRSQSVGSYVTKIPNTNLSHDSGLHTEGFSQNASNTNINQFTDSLIARAGYEPKLALPYAVTVAGTSTPGSVTWVASGSLPSDPLNYYKAFTEGSTGAFVANSDVLPAPYDTSHVYIIRDVNTTSNVFNLALTSSTFTFTVTAGSAVATLTSTTGLATGSLLNAYSLNPGSAFNANMGATFTLTTSGSSTAATVTGISGNLYAGDVIYGDPCILPNTTISIAPNGNGNGAYTLSQNTSGACAGVALTSASTFLNVTAITSTVAGQNLVSGFGSGQELSVGGVGTQYKFDNVPAAASGVLTGVGQLGVYKLSGATFTGNTTGTPTIIAISGISPPQNSTNPIVAGDIIYGNACVPAGTTIVSGGPGVGNYTTSNPTTCTAQGGLKTAHPIINGGAITAMTSGIGWQQPYPKVLTVDSPTQVTLDTKAVTSPGGIATYAIGAQVIAPPINTTNNGSGSHLFKWLDPAANSFNHCAYIGAAWQDAKSIVFRNNLIIGCSLDGLEGRPGGIIDDNFFHSATNAGFCSGNPCTVTNNVIQEMFPNVNTPSGWEIGSFSVGALYDNNIVSDTVNFTWAFAIQLDAPVTFTTFTGNGTAGSTSLVVSSVSANAFSLTTFTGNSTANSNTLNVTGMTGVLFVGNAITGNACIDPTTVVTGTPAGNGNGAYTISPATIGTCSNAALTNVTSLLAPSRGSVFGNACVADGTMLVQGPGGNGTYTLNQPLAGNCVNAALKFGGAVQGTTIRNTIVCGVKGTTGNGIQDFSTYGYTSVNNLTPTSGPAAACNSGGLPGSDPGRTIETYDRDILGGPGTVADFISKAETNSQANWNAAYTAAAVNNWIRAGYGR